MKYCYVSLSVACKFLYTVIVWFPEIKIGVSQMGCAFLSVKELPLSYLNLPSAIKNFVNDTMTRNVTEACVICGMRATLMATQKSGGAPIKPWQVYSKLRLICRHLTPGRQEDAHEFLR